MPSDDNLKISEAPDADRDHPEGHNLGGDRYLSRRTQGTYQLRSLVARHCEQLSSELVDVFRTEAEREVKHRVSEFIVSEATVFCEQMRSKDEVLLAAETKCKDLQEQLELSNRTCRQLQERVRQLEATEAELKVALNQRFEDQRVGAVPLPLESGHLRIVYERKESRMLCRLCVASHSNNETLPVTSFKEDVKLSTLTWHIQHQHPQDYSVLLTMGEEELGEVAKEMSRVGS